MPRVNIKLVQEINLDVLSEFQQGRHAQDNSVLTGLMALNVALRHELISRYTFNARAFFLPNGSRPVPLGLELWPGVFQSLRPAVNSMHINIDTTTGVIFKPGPVIEHALLFLGRNQPAELGNLTVRDRRALRNRLKGLMINITYLHDNEPRQIMGLTDTGATQTMFKLGDGPEISVAQHFQAHGRTLAYPNLPCVDVKKRGKIPMEFCVILPGQLMRKHLPSELTDHMNPQQRLATIRSSFPALNHNSEIITQFGITVDQNPAECPARVLPAPAVMYDQPVNPHNGSWDLRNRRLWRPAEIKGWMLVIFEREKFFDEEATQHTVERLKQACAEKGIQGSNSKLLIERVSAQGDVSKILADLGGRFKRTYGVLPNLVVAIMPRSSGDLHPAVKRFGNIMAGVATQPLKAEKCRKGNMQFFGNVCLKINSKLGGINTVLAPSPESSFLSDVANPTLVLGADVSHPAGHTEGRPSFSALVGSVDSNASKYVATHRVQRSRVEGILDLEEMAMYIIKTFQLYQRNQEKKTNPGPKRIVFYRDGVDEGQFKRVLKNELPALQRACEKCGLDPVPKITIVVVGKRHHTRMFPQNPNDRRQADERSGNCLAGTVIDSVITHPLELDFFLMSHGGLIGTSRPAHYSVIHDDNNFTPDSIQKLSYSLCHVYARATRSVSIPAPVYYADLVCGSAKNHLPPGTELEFSDSGKMSEDEKEEVIKRLRAVYKPTHPNLQRVMYFQ
ncbi:hypothetical protein FRC07_000750 [Ceratobasidium sp. 392]|nr:hypothetical protein FRC07_000750 [Ceratobasidium sp. 392]